MEETNKLNLQNVDISEQVRNSFLDYSMSVIFSRAIPDVRDGLKPVQRRIIYSMYISGITPDKPHKKCARIVGDVMGKFHPHGNDAIYGAVVRLAQTFAMREILVDGHGNFGSIDGDEPAAYRYTEARLSKLALQMVRDIDCDVVDFKDNYDGADKEPVILPSRFPNLLVNGSSGIAVGMATNIPSHNLAEVIDAVIAVAKNPNITLDEIMNIMPGPDFPTGGIILEPDKVKKAYETGNGSITIRSKCFIETENKKNNIIVEEIPYGVNKARLIESIISLVKNKIIDGITNIRDESNIDGIRIVINIRHDCIPEVILNKLYKLTQLQLNFNAIFLCLENNVPKILPIKNILEDYIEYQVNVISKRTNFLLKHSLDRKNIIFGLLKAIENINDIVDIIKNSSTSEEIFKILTEKYNFNELQIQAILEMKLRRLINLENKKLNDELTEITNKIKEYQHILESKNNKLEVIFKELNEIKNKFANKRKTLISNENSEIDEESLVPQQDIVIVLTENSYVKRMPIDIFKTQNRGGVGVRGTVLNENDFIKNFVFTKTHTNLYLFSNKGKVYCLKGYKVPDCSKNSKGVPIQNLINLEKEEKIMSIIDLKNNFENGFLTFFTRNGLVKRTAISEFASIRSNGKIAIKLRENDQLVDVKYTNNDCFVSIASANGKIALFKETQIRPTARNTFGVKGMNVKGTYVISANTSLEGKNILTITENGYGKMTEFSKYRQTNRGAKGSLTLKVTKKTGKLVSTKIVNGDEDLMVINSKETIIRISISQISLINRNTQGVRIIHLENDQKVSSITVLNINHD